MNKTYLGVIPARYNSTRLPGKPLIDINGKPMIQCVYEQVKKSKLLTNVIVATDDQRIYDVVKSFNGNVEFTNKDHKNGTERLIEIYLKYNYDYYLNIQGDEPEINPTCIDDICKLLKNKNIVTLYKKIEDKEEYLDKNTVKAIIASNKRILYFSRSPIPYNLKQNNYNPYKHIGIYGFSYKALFKINQLSESELEKSESLEQLRWLDNGLNIYGVETHFDHIGIDTKEDLYKLLIKWKKK